MGKTWDTDYSFRRAARLAWPDDTAIAEQYGSVSGRAAARRRMTDRYAGFRLLVTLATLRGECDFASQQLAAAAGSGR